MWFFRVISGLSDFNHIYRVFFLKWAETSSNPNTGKESQASLHFVDRRICKSLTEQGCRGGAGPNPATSGCRWREHGFRSAAAAAAPSRFESSSSGSTQPCCDGSKDQSGRANPHFCSPLCLHPKVKPQLNTSFWALTEEREDSDASRSSLTAIMDQTEAAVDEQEA